MISIYVVAGTGYLSLWNMLLIQPLEFLGIFSSVQSFSRVWLFVTPWTAARQASLSITNSWSPPKPMSIVSVIPSNHLILCRLLLLLPSIFPSIRVLSNESALRIRWPKYWSLKHFSPTGRLLVLISIVYSYLWQVGAKGNGILSPFNYKFVRCTLLQSLTYSPGKTVIKNLKLPKKRFPVRTVTVGWQHHS